MIRKTLNQALRKLSDSLDVTADTFVDLVGSLGMIYNSGSENWERIQSAASGFLTGGVLKDITGTPRSVPMSRYEATRPTMTDEQFAVLMSNIRGDLAVQEQYAPGYEDNTNSVAWTTVRALAVATGAWSNYGSGATKIGTAGVVAKASAGRLRRIAAINTSGATNYYLVVLNKATAAAANDVTVDAVPLSNTGASFGLSRGAIDFGSEGIYLSAGISLAISTTPEKVTLAGANDCVIFGQYM